MTRKRFIELVFVLPLVFFGIKKKEIEDEGGYVIPHYDGIEEDIKRMKSDVIHISPQGKVYFK